MLKKMKSSTINYTDSILHYITNNTIQRLCFSYFYFKANKIKRLIEIYMKNGKQFEVYEDYEKIKSDKLKISDIDKLKRIRKNYFVVVYKNNRINLNNYKKTRNKDEYRMKKNSSLLIILFV